MWRCLLALAACGRAGFDPVDDSVRQGSSVFGRFVATGADTARAIATDKDGNLYVVGQFGGTIDFGTGPLVSVGERDAFIVSLDRDGVPRWAQQFGGTGDDDDAESVAVTPEGDVVVGGLFNATVDFGLGPVTSLGTRDIVLLRLDRTGAPIWVRTFGTTAPDTVYGPPTQLGGVAVDEDGTIVFGGSYGGTLDVGGGPLVTVPNGEWYIVLAGLAPDGTHRWSKTLGNTRLNAIRQIALDGGGHVLVAGYYEGTPSFGGPPLPYRGIQDAFVASFDVATGSHQWSRGDGGGGFDYATAVAGTPSRTYAALRSETQFMVDNQTFPVGGIQGSLLLGLDTNGGVAFTRSLDAPACDEIGGFAVGPTGDLYVVGRFEGTFDLGVATLVADELDGYVLRTAADGTPMSVQQRGGKGTDQINGIAFGPDGSGYIVGYYEGANNCGYGPDPVAPGTRDAYIERL